MPLVEKLTLTFDVAELRNYVTLLKTHYQDYSWGFEDMKKLPQTIYMKERVQFAENCYGWAITTENLNLSSKSNTPWPEAVDDTAYQDKTLRKERTTDLVFGIIERLLEKVPFACKISISVFPPGSQTIPHKDQDFLLRVHVPIYTNKDVKWLSEEGYSDLHELGSAYLCDTRKMHSVYNDGTVDRVHLIFAIEQIHIDALKKIKDTIK